MKPGGIWEFQTKIIPKLRIYRYLISRISRVSQKGKTSNTLTPDRYCIANVLYDKITINLLQYIALNIGAGGVCLK